MDTSIWARPELIWFIIGLVLLLMEFATPGLVVFFFGIGAWIVSAICLIIGLSLNVQLGLFIISSLLLLLMLRSRLRKVFMGFSTSDQDGSADLPEFVGETAVVVKEIKGGIKGRVEMHGTEWDALCETSDIPVGETVRVIGKQSIALKVEPLSK